jgi:hypothetical protein
VPFKKPKEKEDAGGESKQRASAAHKGVAAKAKAKEGAAKKGGAKESKRDEAQDAAAKESKRDEAQDAAVDGGAASRSETRTEVHDEGAAALPLPSKHSAAGDEQEGAAAAGGE